MPSSAMMHVTFSGWSDGAPILSCSETAVDDPIHYTRGKHKRRRANFFPAQLSVQALDAAADEAECHGPRRPRSQRPWAEPADIPPAKHARTGEQEHHEPAEPPAETPADILAGIEGAPADPLEDHDLGGGLDWAADADDLVGDAFGEVDDSIDPEAAYAHAPCGQCAEIWVTEIHGHRPIRA